MVERTYIVLLVLLIVQAILTGLVWMVNPILVTHQVAAAGYIASSLLILAMIVYVYYRGDDYDQEWIAAGVGMIVLILLLTYIKGGF
ncbi:MAG: hypothetical protein NZ929_03915 [Aigarchaeota archaeon]|nr:hypothetical protein [Aigarchaeota archaeon]MCX8192771.1 hypothetical protein [Nitrososphaeria archaeon]MDW7986018.1 hypothetical protein [Nitrososphaerota archaeon]